MATSFPPAPDRAIAATPELICCDCQIGRKKNLVCRYKTAMRYTVLGTSTVWASLASNSCVRQWRGV